MIVDSPVPDITWLSFDEEQPRGVEVIYDLPRDLQEIQVNISVPLIGGPFDGSHPIVNSNPLPEHIVKVQHVSFADRGINMRSMYGPDDPSLKRCDPAHYIATKFTYRHLYHLEDHGIACAYFYMGWWKP